MNASHILDALGMIDDKYIVEAKEGNLVNTTKKAHGMKRTLVLVAVIATLLILCGFAAYQLGCVSTHGCKSRLPIRCKPSKAQLRAKLGRNIRLACVSMKSRWMMMKRRVLWRCIPAASLPRRELWTGRVSGKTLCCRIC